MDAERYQGIGDLYHGALEVSPEQRAAFLDDACGSDSELRREVESLRRAHQAGEFIGAPAIEVAAAWLAHEEGTNRTRRSARPLHDPLRARRGRYG
jgi:hypothetical protein